MAVTVSKSWATKAAVAIAAIAAPFAATVADVPAHAAVSAPVVNGTKPGTTMTTEQALAKAVATGTAVAVADATTDTDTVTANPDGTLTLTRAALPVRKLVNGAWHDLDATLVADANGTIHPRYSAHGLTLYPGNTQATNGGGSLLAVMTNTGHSLGLSVPATMTLRPPRLSGDTATYANVLNGVDLQVRADTQGGFRQVFVIHDAAAASSAASALSTINMGLTADGVSVSADADANLTAVDRAGHPIFTAPAPTMWDSATPATATATVGALTSKKTAAVSADALHEADVAVAVHPDSITLTPDSGLLSASSTVYPVFVDPGWSSVGSAKSGWATVAKNYPGTNYWNDTPDKEGLMQAGYSGSIQSHTLINMAIDTGTLAGADIHAATLDITETNSYSCTPSVINLYAPSQTLTKSNATWNSWDGKLGSPVDSANVAHGYNSSCPAKGISFDVTSAIVNDVKNGKKTQTFGLAGANEKVVDSWKEFKPSTPYLTIHYNHTPNRPTGLSTSPATSCAPNTLTIIGDGDVTLYAPVSDRDGGNLSVQFALYKFPDLTTPMTTSSTGFDYPSGSTAVFRIPKSTLEGASNKVITRFAWKARVSDNLAWSDWSTPICTFDFDPTRPGGPAVPPPTGTQIGQPVSLTITAADPNNAPTSYLYQLNGAAPNTITATNGTATITIKPTRYTNVLTVTGTSLGGNIGTDTSVSVFNSTPANTTVDQDLTGDNIPDLLTVGGTSGMPAGLWIAANQATAGTTTGSGQIITTAIDLGANGRSITAPSPTSFNGAQAIAGIFTDSNLQDILAYYPTGTNAGSAIILHTNGDGSVIQVQQSTNSIELPAGTFIDENGDNPIQLVNAGNISGRGLHFADLLGVSGDSANGYYLAFYPNSDLIGGYNDSKPLTTTTPTGGTDWNTWTLASAQTPTGTALYLWQKTTGALYLWTNLSYNNDPDNPTISHDPPISLGTWNPNAAISLQAADVDNNGTADLWTTSTSGTTTAWINNGTALTAAPAQNLITPSHTWTLTEGPSTNATSGALTTAVDSTTGLNATAANGVTWKTGGLFGTDATFDGTGALTTNGPAINPNADFTLSAWVKPNTAGSYLLSQDGAKTEASIALYAAANNTWTFGMSQTDAATTTWDLASSTGAPIQYGTWQHVTATYSKATSTMTLYLNGAPIATKTHTTTRSDTGKFQIGDYQHNAGHTNYLNGETAEVQVWNQTLSAQQIALLANK